MWVWRGSLFFSPQAGLDVVSMEQEAAHAREIVWKLAQEGRSLCAYAAYQEKDNSSHMNISGSKYERA